MSGTWLSAFRSTSSASIQHLPIVPTKRIESEVKRVEVKEEPEKEQEETSLFEEPQKEEEEEKEKKTIAVEEEEKKEIVAERIHHMNETNEKASSKQHDTLSVEKTNKNKKKSVKIGDMMKIAAPKPKRYNHDKYNNPKLYTISSNDSRRIMNRAAVVRSTDAVKLMAARVARVILKGIVQKSILYAEHERKKTINSNHVVHATRSFGITILNSE